MHAMLLLVSSVPTPRVPPVPLAEAVCDLPSTVVQCEGPSSGIICFHFCPFHSVNQTDFLFLFKYLYMCVIASCLNSLQSDRGNKEQTISVW